MSPDRDIIAPGTRNRLRDMMNVVVERAIRAAFESEGFAPNPDCTWSDGRVRTTTAEHYLCGIDWTNHRQVDRALRVFTELVEDFDDGDRQKLRQALRRDGYELAADGGISRSAPETPGLSSIASLRDPAAIMDNLERIGRAVGTDDSAQVIGSAKELIESTAKTVLTQLGLPVDETDDVPALVAQAQQALHLHPSAGAPGPDGNPAVKKVLGAVITVTTGVAELRNRNYGTGHGPGTERHGLSPRHARLAVNAARTWCELILDTLADAKAPWQRPTP